MSIGGELQITFLLIAFAGDTVTPVTGISVATADRVGLNPCKIKNVKKILERQNVKVHGKANPSVTYAFKNHIAYHQIIVYNFITKSRRNG